MIASELSGVYDAALASAYPILWMMVAITAITLLIVVPYVVVSKSLRATHNSIMIGICCAAALAVLLQFPEITLISAGAQFLSFVGTCYVVYAFGVLLGLFLPVSAKDWILRIGTKIITVE